MKRGGGGGGSGITTVCMVGGRREYTCLLALFWLSFLWICLSVVSVRLALPASCASSWLSRSTLVVASSAPVMCVHLLHYLPLPADFLFPSLSLRPFLPFIPLLVP